MAKSVSPASTSEATNKPFTLQSDLDLNYGLPEPRHVVIVCVEGVSHGQGNEGCCSTCGAGGDDVLNFLVYV